MPQMRHSEAMLSEKLSQLEKLPQPVVAYGRELKKGEVLPFHRHQRAQLVYASQGVMSVTTRSASFVVPPQRAVWMPRETEHRVEAHSDVAIRTLYIDPHVLTSLPEEACILQVTPLLRELIVTAVAAGAVYEPSSPQSRIMSVILDQIGVLPIVSLALPTPQDSRLLRITRSLIENPADQRDLEKWAIEVGASKRTLNRLFSAQTGMSFSAWRQQRRIHRALELLIIGKSVTSIALELGYENTSAFIAMFKRCLGTTPSHYFDRRNSS